MMWRQARRTRRHLAHAVSVCLEEASAEPVVIHPGGMGHARVERHSFGDRVAALRHELPSLSATASAARNRNRLRSP